MASLVQILLPLTDNEDQPYPQALFARVRQELVDRFGGVTAQLGAPAEGVWRDSGEVVLDSIVVFETMVDHLQREWWSDYRRELERRFGQREIVVRVIPIERI